MSVLGLVSCVGRVGRGRFLGAILLVGRVAKTMRIGFFGRLLALAYVFFGRMISHCGRVLEGCQA